MTAEFASVSSKEGIVCRHVADQVSDQAEVRAGLTVKATAT